MMETILDRESTHSGNTAVQEPSSYIYEALGDGDSI
jgi:hypothetical protein